MALKNDFELENTRKKLRLLEERYEESLRETGGDEYLRAVSRRTVKRWINRMTEEIIRYEIQKKVAAARAADSVPEGPVTAGTSSS